MAAIGLLGYGAKEIFEYNRANFKFDQDQLIQRESFRLSMQVRRFKVFREDVRDLVAMTVDRMDIYHLVGALVLQFCIILFCEGRVQQAAPPFLLSLFLLSVGSAFVYLLLSVWLSMHASIAAHSFGVRLLTRFVRLPIPSLRQIEGLRFNYKDFERQGTSMLKVPFVSKGSEWSQVNPKSAPWSPAGVAADAVLDEEDTTSGATPKKKTLRRIFKKKQAGYNKLTGSGGTGIQDDDVDITQENQGAPLHWSEDIPVAGVEDINLLPDDENFQAPTGGEELLTSQHGAKEERHIQLFRRLQGKWQCYDAYCRVCMSLGLNQVLQGMSYYVVCHTQVENHSPSTGYALIVMFQCTTIGLAILDLSGLAHIEILLVQILGMMPCTLTSWGIAHRKHVGGGVLDPTEAYPLSPLSFLCQVLWLELWLRIAWPSDDDAKLPRRFRQTLFLDVFGDARETDPELANDVKWDLDDPEEDDEAKLVQGAAYKASTSYRLAQFAVRRWRAAPEWGMTTDQRKALSKSVEKLNTWGGILRAELDRDQELCKIPLESELRPIRLMSEEERATDPFLGALIGPFEHDGGDSIMYYHYDVEQEQMIWGDGQTTSHGLVLSLKALSRQLDELEREARSLLEARIKRDLRIATQQPKSGSVVTKQSSAEANLVSKFPRKCFSLAQTGPGSAAINHRGGTRFLSNLVELFIRPTAQCRRHSDEAGPVTGGSSPGGGSAKAGNAGEAPVSRHPSFSRDPTLRAMAGRHAKEFVPERLPWLVVSRMTRVLQFAWLLSGVMAVLKEVGTYQIDFQQHPHRRLQSVEVHHLLAEEVFSGPSQTVFRAEGLHCLRPGHLLLPTRFSLFTSTLETMSPLAVEGVNSEIAYRLPPPLSVSRPVSWAYATRMQNRSSAAQPAVANAGRPGTPTSASVTSHRHQILRAEAVVCGSAENHEGVVKQQCLALSLTKPDRLLIWSLSEELAHADVTELELEGLPWKSVAAVTAKCSDFVGTILSDASDDHEWCLLVAGFDGASVPLVIIDLPNGPGRPPVAQPTSSTKHPVSPFFMPPGASDSRRLKPGLEVPLETSDIQVGVAALSIEPLSFRLWILLASGEVIAWDLVQARLLGRWLPLVRADQKHTMRSVALCEDALHGLVLLARDSNELHGKRLFNSWPLGRPGVHKEQTGLV